MPYKVYKGSDGQWCVHKKDDDGAKGDQVKGGCHDSEDKAKNHMKALYAAETKETDDKHYNDYDSTEYVPWGVFSFDDLQKAKDARAAAVKVRTLSDQFAEIVANIMGSTEVDNKSSAVKSLADEYSTLIDTEVGEATKEEGLVERVKSVVNDVLTDVLGRKDKPAQQRGFMLWKDKDRLRWFTRYSNNFRDDDSPPEIISAESHGRFVGLVDSKEVPLPELWLWHVPEWRLGEADWVAFDDSGFALASGLIDRGKELAAEQIAKEQLAGVSHGMPVSSIKRDPNDPTVIIEHETAEISVGLPPQAAANKLADWVIMDDPANSKEGINMPIPDQKKQDLLERWKIDPEMLEQLEALNEEDAQKANEDGRESKEQTPPDNSDSSLNKDDQAKDEAETTDEEQVDGEPEADAPDAKPDDDDPLTREEIADAITTVLKPYMDLSDTLRGAVKELQSDVKELLEDDETKVAKAASLTPNASVSALLAQRFSAIGDDTAKIDGRKGLSKSKPEEAKDEDEQREKPTNIPFIDQMLIGEAEKE